MDMIDKAIIRILLKYKDQYLTTYQIAQKVGIAPLTAKRHLGNLENEGYVNSKISGGIRKYELGNG